MRVSFHLVVLMVSATVIGTTRFAFCDDVLPFERSMSRKVLPSSILSVSMDIVSLLMRLPPLLCCVWAEIAPLSVGGLFCELTLDQGIAAWLVDLIDQLRMDI